MDLNFNTHKKVYISNGTMSNKKNVAKKDVSEVLCDNNIEKIRQLAYRDAIKGERSSESTSFLHQCREKVAPDRKKIFVNAEKGMTSKIEEYKAMNIWLYLLEANGKFNGGSYSGTQGSDGHVFMRAYDENGEEVGIYDSNYGWSTTWTSAENQVWDKLVNVYNETYNSVYKEAHRKITTSDISADTRSNLDIKA